MARRSGKKNVASFFRRKLKASRRTKLQPVVTPLPLLVVPETASTSAGAKGAKKKAGSRLWMLFDRSGKSEIIELDKSSIMRRASIPARDLRILGPLFAHSSRIIVREKAMVVNLEFIKVIITADEVLLLNPLCNEVLPFVDQLRRQIFLNPPSKLHEIRNADESGKNLSSTAGQRLHNENDEDELVLPFELQVLDVALGIVCTSLESSVTDLVRNLYLALDELTKHVSNKNLERVRSLKSNLTRLLSRVQKVRDEIEHLLDNNEDMPQFYLTRKQMQSHQLEAALAAATSISTVPAPQYVRLNSQAGGSSSSVSFPLDENNVEDLEMMFEASFMQLEGTRNKILALDNQRNELIKLQLFLGIFSFAMGVDSMIAGLFGMNIPCSLYNIDNLFTSFVIGSTAVSFLIFLLLLLYARWKKLLGS
ncbi:magnesium transporter MRS2-4-like isoform X2 [Phalaenopsis equestris]|uniref:magnesium transporter MRS2-4-like isoform X2 n=1 Tax=Phalaenopsis equestris TaxID=78828 RepID=UPI0009E5009F|nr:magnesium transporter MRS2-4-like isoform X2 [Phalaenopsis equestris]